ncbi:MAG: ABC transporter ATP-binding protein [Pseudomonadota bacterium]
MLKVDDLSVHYGQHRALDHASLQVDNGEIAVILGANGAGKSTLLRAISGICEGTVDGSISVDGVDIAGLGADQIVEHGVALVPEGRGIFGDLSVRENLLLGAYPQRARDGEVENLSRVCELFPRLQERLKQTARTMSGGEQQMVAIGRAMMSAPRILMLDEPSLGLSPLLCKELFANLRRVCDSGIGILLVEQNAKQSLAIADRGYLLENAHIVHEDTAANLARDSAVQAAYLGGARSGSQHPAHTASAAPDTGERTKEVPFIDVVEQRRGYTSADDLLGTSIGQLVSSATASAQPPSPPSAPQAHDPDDDHDQRVRALLNEMESSAAGAATRVAGRRNAKQPQTSPAQDPKAPQKPPVIEVYRAPRVEVYRRRPGSSRLERDK